MKSKNQEYKTILIITIGLAVMYVLFHSVYFLYASVAIGFVSLLSHVATNLIHVAWMKLAKLLSYIMPNIILSVFFFLLLTPISLLQKLLKKQTSYFSSNTRESTFIESIKKTDNTHFEKPW